MDPTQPDKDKRTIKRCVGVIVCETPGCVREGTDLAPGSTIKRTEEHIAEKVCHSCKKPQKYVVKKLRADTAEKVTRAINMSAGATTSELYAGMSKRTVNLPDIQALDISLYNKGKLKYIHQKAQVAAETEAKEKDEDDREEDGDQVPKKVTKPPKHEGSVEDILRLRKDYPNYIRCFSFYDDIAIITIWPPTLGPYLNLSAFPLVTDTTFSVFGEEGWYLCTSVIMSAFHCSHVVAFAAVINGQTARHFEYYFQELFRQYAIDFNDPNAFLGVLMDFSQSQVSGFLEAYRTETGRNDGLKYIKCCNVHYRRNARRFTETYAADLGKKAEKTLMRDLLKELLFTDSKKRYHVILKEIERLYPKKGRSFAKWYNRKNVRGTIFPAVSTMNERLQQSLVKDTNAVESFHNRLYKLIHKNQKILVNLRQVCHLVNHEEHRFIAYQHGADPDFGVHNEQRPRKRTRTKKYKDNGRAPDMLSTLTAEYASDSCGTIYSDGYESGNGFQIDEGDEDRAGSELEFDSDKNGEQEKNLLDNDEQKGDDSDNDGDDETEAESNPGDKKNSGGKKSDEIMKHLASHDTNAYDEALVSAYLAYDSEYKSRSEGLQALRQFVWDNTPYDQNFCDCSEFFEHFVTALSDHWKLPLRLATTHYTACENGHEYNHNTQYMAYIHIKTDLYGATRYALKKYQKLEEDDNGSGDSELAEAFANGLLNLVTNTKPKVCLHCNSPAIRKTVVFDWPQFLCIQDWGPRIDGAVATNTPMPVRMNISDNSKS
ncbi:hypothetical protein BJV82DRAFT_584474 [Fennellomyces sp. T-0311]|nr:hypothetical protein BJV82DRAFT_584474 [Fennellomyces sp. T-0311]